MEPVRLNPEDIEVSSFDVEAAGPMAARLPDPFCCTGCVSGCGINPTAGYCESGGGSGDIFCSVEMGGVAL
ncbi:MAG TPA: hypothetical protein VFX98_18860 [Longimicrobiaceae bacterium]|nr:hypothetical protein [Longimicrobiaceae bacterium]